MQIFWRTALRRTSNSVLDLQLPSNPLYVEPTVLPFSDCPGRSTGPGHIMDGWSGLSNDSAPSSDRRLRGGNEPDRDQVVLFDGLSEVFEHRHLLIAEFHRHHALCVLDATALGEAPPLTAQLCQLCHTKWAPMLGDFGPCCNRRKRQYREPVLPRR